MKVSKEVRRLTKELFQASFTDSRLDESKVRQIVQKIVSDKPRHYVDLLKNYHRLIRLETEKRRAIIESATQLDPATATRVANGLRAKYGSDLATEFRTNPGLIGGLRIRVGDDVYDGSVQGRLQRLEQELAVA